MSNQFPIPGGPGSGGGGGPVDVDDLVTSDTNQNKILKPDGAGGAVWEFDPVGIFFQADIVMPLADAPQASRVIYNGTTNNVSVTLPLESTVAADYILLVENQSPRKNAVVTVLAQGGDVIIGDVTLRSGELFSVTRTGVGEYSTDTLATSLSEPAKVQVASASGGQIWNETQNQWVPAENFADTPTWDYDTDTTMADPGTGNIRVDNADITLATQVATSNTTNQGADISGLVSIIRANAFADLREYGDFTKTLFATITNVTDNGTWTLFDISVVAATTFDTNSILAFNLIDNVGVPNPVGSVTGDGVDNTDPANPVLSYPAPADIGLGNVDNTSDADKPVSTAQQSALDGKANLFIPTVGGNLATLNPSGDLNDSGKQPTDFLEAVTSDSTLSGDGTAGNPLSVATPVPASAVGELLTTVAVDLSPTNTGLGTKFNFNTLGQIVNASGNLVSDRITVNVAGSYKVTLDGTVVMKRDKDFTLNFALNGVLIRTAGRLRTPEDNYCVNFSAAMTIPLAANDYIEAFVLGADAGQKFEIEVGTCLIVERVA